MNTQADMAETIANPSIPAPQENHLRAQLGELQKFLSQNNSWPQPQEESKTFCGMLNMSSLAT